MKKIVLSFLALLFFVIAHSQSDTLFTKKQKKVICKITEINELDIKYTLAGNPDGPVYVVNKATIFKYTLSNGYTELIVPDELSLENEHADIIKNRQVIKISPFSAVNNQVSLSYEKVIKVGMNLDVELGYSNSSFSENEIFSNWYMGNTFNYGFYLKPGMKFFLGQDHSVRGLKYAHPLKGRYIRLDLAVSYLQFKDAIAYVYSMTPGPYGGYYTTYKTTKTDISTLAYGGFVNYGRQFILGNILTIEYYVGVGFTGQSYSYSNKEYASKINNPYNYYDAKYISNYHGFYRTQTVGLSGTAGLRIGYIIPVKQKPGSHKN